MQAALVSSSPGWVSPLVFSKSGYIPDNKMPSSRININDIISSFLAPLRFSYTLLQKCNNFKENFPLQSLGMCYIKYSTIIQLVHVSITNDIFVFYITCPLLFYFHKTSLLMEIPWIFSLLLNSTVFLSQVWVFLLKIIKKWWKQ